jgi:hypothetical protein
MEGDHGEFVIDAVQRLGKWRALIRRKNGSVVRVGSERRTMYSPAEETLTRAEALAIARRWIDEGGVK